MAEDSVVAAADKFGRGLLAAVTVVKRATELERQIAGYEVQVLRLRDALTGDRQVLEDLRVETRDVTEQLGVARKETEGAEAERDRRLRDVAREEEKATSQLRTVAQRDREQIHRQTEALARELETKKGEIRNELDEESRRLRTELGRLEADIEGAKETLQKTKKAHQEFVESVSGNLPAQVT